MKQIEQEYFERYEAAYGEKQQDYLDSGGSFQFKAEGEHHLFNPKTIYHFQKAVRTGDYQLYKEYAAVMNQEALSTPTTLRSLWGVHTFASANSIGGSRACCPNRQTIQSRSNVLWIAK